MNLYINVILAWLTTLFAFLAVIIWLMRIGVKSEKIKKGSVLYRAHSKLRKRHKAIGIIFIILAFIHGLLSSYAVFSFNFGTLCWLVGILLGLSMLLKKKLQRDDWFFLHRLLSVVLVLFFAMHLVEIGGAPMTKQLLTRDKPADETQEQSDASGISIAPFEQDAVEGEADAAAEAIAPSTLPVTNQYQDGVYTGIADAFGPDLTVEVTLQDNQIKAIEIVSHNEQNISFYGPAFEAVPDAIMDAQSTQVDSVSGATYSSIGIKNAVIDALSQALISGALPEQETLTGGKRH